MHTTLASWHKSRLIIRIGQVHDLAMVGSRIERQNNVGTLHQTLGNGLTARDLCQAGPLSCGQLDPRDTEEDGATAVVIRASFRRHCAMFGSYDTISMSV